MIEDNKDDALLIERELVHGGYTVDSKRVETEEELKSAVSRQYWDVVIADFNLPRFNGINALTILKENQLDIPFIIVSGVIGEETAVSAMKAGAHDYIMKTNLSRLVPAVERECRDAEVRWERWHAQRALRESEARFSAFMTHFPGFAFIKDEHGKYLYMNSYLETAFGLCVEDCLGKTDSDLWPPDIAECARDQDQRALESGEVVESVETRKNGADLASYLTFRFPIRRSGLQPLLGGFSLDITARKDAEEALFQKQQQLRALASQLTLAEERERRRISTELHDQLGQTLAMATMKLGALMKNRPAGTALDELNVLRELLVSAIRQTRSLTFELSSPILHEVGLEAAVEQLCERMEAEHGVAFSAAGGGQQDFLDEDVKIFLFQVIRELLFNIVKHAKATQATVTFHRQKDHFVVTVTDNGVGIDCKPPHASESFGPGGGFGLFNARERLDHIGGSFVIESQSGAGTCITMTVPVCPVEE
mgnify:CR=1 FL=1